jgi:hypothetical protein
VFVPQCKVFVKMPKPSEQTNKKVAEIVNNLRDDKFYNEFLEMAKGIPIFFLQPKKNCFQYSL